jgi:hypothetical protein
MKTPPFFLFSSAKEKMIPLSKLPTPLNLFSNESLIHQTAAGYSPKPNAAAPARGRKLIGCDFFYFLF